MKKLTLFTLFAILIFFLPMPSLLAQTIDPNAVDGEIFFELKSSAALKAQGIKGMVDINKLPVLKGLKNAYALTRVRRPFYQTSDGELQRIYLLYFKNIRDVNQLISELKKKKDVVYAEKAPLFHIFYKPNDPKYTSNPNYRWFLDVIQAAKAWDIQKGNPDIKVAVLDNAIDIHHPDLESKIFAKIDLANNDDDPTPPKQNMDWAHGTHVAGLVGAATDNNIGIASIGFNIDLMAVKISNDSTDGRYMSYGYQGIVWAADHGANVISMSWGGPGYYQTGQNVVNYAYNKGCVMVAAAGNDGDSAPSYPADYHHVISVASTNSDDVKSSFSQYGSAVDVCAPGGSNSNGYGIFSTVDYVTSQYGYMQGTSMATPIVSGLAGLMLSEDSTLTPEKLEAIMKNTCDNIDAKNPGFNGQLGAGRINAYKAIQAVQDSMALHAIVANFKASSVIIPEGNSVDFTDLSKGNPISWKWTFQGGNPSHSSVQNPTNIQYAKPGSYKVTLTVSNGAEANTETKTDFILVYPLISGAWMPQATGFSSQSRGINYISIVNQDVVWANAYDGSGNNAIVHEFTKTVDGGEKWKPGSYTNVPLQYVVSCITAIDTSHAWIAMYSKNSPFGYGGIFATTDGGKTWTHQASAAFGNKASFPDIVYFWNKNEGVCMGDPVNGYFEIYTTTNGGDKWTQVKNASIPASLPGEYGYTNLYAVYRNTIWFGTNKGRIFKSTDKGKHWVTFSTGLNDLTTLGFHNDTLGVATYTQFDQSGNSIIGFHIVKSIDGGKTWEKVTPSGDYYKTGMAVIPDAPGMLVSTGISQDLAQSGSAYSLDEGNTWTQLDDSVQYTSVKFYNSAVGWAGGFNESPTSRGIWKWMGIPTTAVNQAPSNDRMKIYPNPSTGKIHFYIPVAKKVFEISVFDIQGRLLERFKDMVVNSSHEYVVNLSHLKKGIYIAVMKTDRTFTKKKIIIQ